MPLPNFRLTQLLTAFVATVGWCAGAQAETGPITLEKHIKPLLQEFCFDCHNPQKEKGDLNLIEFSDNPKLYEHREVWEKVMEVMEAGEMPPEKKAQPSMEQKEKIIHFIDAQLAKFDCKTDKDPGRVTIRRLNKEEYRNTVRDLLKVNYQPEDFPNDEVGYGFDNIGDVLSLSPMLMEKFVGAAEEIAGLAIVLPDPVTPGWHRVRKGTVRFSNDAARWQEETTLLFASESEAIIGVHAPEAGEWRLRIKGYGDQAGNEPAKLRVALGAQEIKVLEIPAVRDQEGTYEVRFPVTAGDHELRLAFINDYSGSDAGKPGDRNVFLQMVEIEGRMALRPAGIPESQKMLITREPEVGKEREMARELLRPFLRRAYRRPVGDAEVERVARFVDLALQQKGTFAEGMQVAVQAVLSSPHFLFRWELDPDTLLPGQMRDLSDWEVASRLSYFLWSSMPDEELFRVAEAGELRKADNLQKQIVRMIKDWRARAFVTNFAGQWLQIRNIWELSPDPDVFPKWRDELKGAMKEETELFFQAIMQEDRPVTDLLAADFTYLNEKLAKFYGVQGVQGNKFQRVALPPDSPRGGVLTHGSVLLATSTPTRTAPVIRGKWILEQILGQEPPPPPADVPPLEEKKQGDASASLRQRLEQHRANVECAGCHAKMDPLGFALENFDATGSWRDKDGKFPIDASGKIAGGISFNGPRELKAVLKNDKRFVHCLAEKMMTYALGRGLEYYDRCAVDTIVLAMAGQENRFSSLVAGIVTSEPFLKRKKAGGELATK